MKPAKLSDENYTPNTESQPAIALVIKTLGGWIDLDPTSNTFIRPDSFPNIPAKRHFTAKDSCLTKSWEAENVYMNPPWSDPGPYVVKFCEEFNKGNFSQGIICLESKNQGSKVTGQEIERNASAICQWGAGKTIPNRLGFIEAETGKHRTGFTLCSIFVYFGPNWTRFYHTFEPYGHVMATSKTIKNLILTP